MTWLYAGLGVLVAGALGVVVLWLRGLLSDRVALGQRDAALRVAEKRIDAMEKADAAQRVARAKELDDKATTVRTAADAARLLREQLARTRKPR